MPECLIALGSNLGDRAANLRRAVAALDAAPLTRIISRSGWHETPPVGGPAGQGAYLNAAVLAATLLDPVALWTNLTRIEAGLGRVRERRWEARTVDLDVLLYDRVMLASPELTIPHPRMHYRGFVLAPAAEVAPWMVHPECAWTVALLYEQLKSGADEIAVAAVDPHLGAWLVDQLGGYFRLTASGLPRVRAWTPDCITSQRPRLILAAPNAAGSGGPAMRKILQLPPTGPIAWLTLGDRDAMLNEATAIVASAWSALAAAPTKN